jgi:hypothetical protein
MKGAGCAVLDDLKESRGMERLARCLTLLRW